MVGALVLAVTSLGMTDASMTRSSGTYNVCRPDHWAFAGTDLRYGDGLGLGSHIVGYEVDGCDMVLENGIPKPTGSDGTPKDMTILATAPAHLQHRGGE
jgi:hypothetical protein